MTTKVTEMNDSAYGPDIGCIEAYSTTEANYYRFRTHAGAKGYDSTLTDSFSVNYFVMDFVGKDALVNDHPSAMQQLAGSEDDYEGDLRVR